MTSLQSLFFNKDTVSVWISVIGTFLGTILAGIISAKIAIWTYKNQKLIYNNQESKNREKGLQMVEEFVNLAISCLLLIEPGENGRVSPITMMMVQLKELKDINSELSNIPNKLISLDINIPFQNIRILLKILAAEIEEVLTHQYESEDKIFKRLKNVNIEGRLEKILEYLTSFSKREIFNELYEDLKNTKRCM